MREAKRKTIDGTTYSITPLNPMKSAKILVRLTKALGPSVGMLVDAFKGSDKASVMDMDIGEPISKAIQHLDMSDSEFENLFNSLWVSECISFAKEGDDNFMRVKSVDMHFASFNIAHMFKVLAFILEVNYGDFLGALGVSRGQ